MAPEGMDAGRMRFLFEDMKKELRKKIIEWTVYGLILATVLFMIGAECYAQDSSSLPIAPLDVTALIEKLGGWSVVAVLLCKLIFNDIAHLKAELEKVNASIAGVDATLKLLVRLQAEQMGKNPDLIEAQMISKGVKTEGT